MADPISIFPLFTRNQAFPPTGGGGGDPIPVVPIEVELVEDSPLAATVSSSVIVVVLDEDFNVCATSVRST